MQIITLKEINQRIKRYHKYNRFHLNEIKNEKNLLIQKLYEEIIKDNIRMLDLLIKYKTELEKKDLRNLITNRRNYQRNYYKND